MTRSCGRSEFSRSAVGPGHPLEVDELLDSAERRSGARWFAAAMPDAGPSNPRQRRKRRPGTSGRWGNRSGQSMAMAVIGRLRTSAHVFVDRLGDELPLRRSLARARGSSWRAVRASSRSSLRSSRGARRSSGPSASAPRTAQPGSPSCGSRRTGTSRPGRRRPRRRLEAGLRPEHLQRTEPRGVDEEGPAGKPNSSRWVVVWRPRESGPAHRAVAWRSSPSSALTSVDFPTPDDPRIAAVVPGAEVSPQVVSPCAGPAGPGRSRRPVRRPRRRRRRPSTSSARSDLLRTTTGRIPLDQATAS